MSNKTVEVNSQESSTLDVVMPRVAQMATEMGIADLTMAEWVAVSGLVAGVEPVDDDEFDLRRKITAVTDTERLQAATDRIVSLNVLKNTLLAQIKRVDEADDIPPAIFAPDLEVQLSLPETVDVIAGQYWG